MFLRTPIDQFHAAPATHAAQARSAAPPERIAGPSVATVWREALATFVLHAPAILLVACVCIAGPAVLCQLASVVLGFKFYGQASGPFATSLGASTLRNGSINPVSVMITIQAGLSGIGLAFARGVIARLALSDAGDRLSLRLACREASARFPSLLVGSLLYGICVTAGAVGINATLCNSVLDLRAIGAHSATPAGPLHALARGTLDALVPSPGAPFTEFVPALRFSILDPLTQLTIYEKYLVVQVGEENVITGNKFAGLWWVTATSVIVLLLTEALLRFTPIMVMDSSGRARLRAVTLALRIMRFGIRHFGTITMHVWLLRLAFVASYGVFFMLPIVLSQDIAPPIVRSVTRSVLDSWSVTLTLVCYALITALFVMFCTVYDARLVMQFGTTGRNTNLQR